MSLEKEREILSFVREYHAKNQWAPTIREIGAAVGLYSSSSVQRYLEILARKKKIVYKGVRQIRVLKSE